MTVPIYGRVTPIQAAMLDIGGVVCSVPDDLVDQDRKIEGMRRSRELLRKSTGADFGYDIRAWHEYLLDSEQHRDRYTFEYAWAAVQPKILELIDDPERMRLLRIVEELDRSQADE